MVTIIMMMMVNLDDDYTIFNLSQTWSPRTWQWLAIPFAKEGKGRLPSRSEAFDEIILIFDQKIIRLFCFLIKWSSGKTQQVQPSTLPIPLGGKRLVPGEMMVSMRSWWWSCVTSMQCVSKFIAMHRTSQPLHQSTFVQKSHNTAILFFTYYYYHSRVNPFLNIKTKPCLEFFFRRVCWRESDV